MAEASRQDVEARLEEYSEFVKNVLRPDFEVADKAEREIKQEIDDYKDLERQLTQIDPDKPMYPLVDLGHQLVHCKAQVDDTNMVYVHVGMGFHVELKIVEALAFVQNRVNFLSDDVLSLRSSRTQQLREHLAVSQTILDRLSCELEKL